jgi:hypothetical protein
MFRPKWLGARIQHILSQVLTDNENWDLTVNRFGALYVQNIGAKPPAQGAPNDDSGFVVAHSVGTPCSLFTVNGFVPPSVSDLYIQFFDAVSTPANGSTPLQSIYVPAGSNFSWTPAWPMEFQTGLTIVGSSTPNTLTAAGVSFWYFMQYLD